MTGKFGRTSRIGRIGRTGRLLDRVVLGIQASYLGGLEAPLWHHWDTILVIQGSPGTPKRTPWGPDLDFYRFWEDFGTLFLTHFGIILVTFSRFGAANWQYGFQGCFFSELGVAILLNPMAACA